MKCLELMNLPLWYSLSDVQILSEKRKGVYDQKARTLLRVFIKKENKISRQAKDLYIQGYSS